MNNTNLSPDTIQQPPLPAQNPLFSPKNLPFLIIYSLVLILLSVTTTYFVLQSNSNLQTSIQPTITMSGPQLGRSCPIGDESCLPPDPTQPPIVAPIFTSEDEQALQTLTLGKLQGDTSFPEGTHPVVIAINIEGDWAAIGVLRVYDDSMKPVPSEGITLLGYMQSGRWQVETQGSSVFRKWLDLVPDSLLKPQVKTHLKESLYE